MFAAYSAAINGNRVLLLEKNEKLGKKIYITGKGRCNLTNDVSESEFIKNVVSNPKFMYGAVFALSPEKTMDFFENNGLHLKVERGNRVFPVSDKASDVTKTLQNVLIRIGVEIMLNSEVASIIFRESSVTGVVLSDGRTIDCDSVIVCTGGVSYPLTGSTGDGFKFAKSAGHSIVSPKPALVGAELQGDDFRPLQGLTLKNVGISVFLNEKCVYDDFGEMLFTHFGVSGPIILSCSSIINRMNVSSLILSVDLKPALESSVLDKRLLRDFTLNNAKSISGVLRLLLPQSVISLILTRAKIKEKTKCAEITREERCALVSVIKNLKFKMKRLRPIEEAVVTSGGVNVKEINPKTMESKLVQGLYFAGEVIDVDCFTGGFNLQTAFSTGFVAGKNA